MKFSPYSEPQRRSCILAVSGLLLSTILLRWTVRDAWVWSALWTYLTPWPVLTVVAAVSARWGWSRFLGGLALVLLLITLRTGVGWRASVIPADAMHLRVWNVGESTNRFPERLAVLMRGKPDAILLTDSGIFARWLERYPEYMSGYEAVLMGERGFTLLVPASTPARFVKWIQSRDRHTRLGWVDMGDFDLLMVELDFRPFVSKQRVFSDLDRQIEQQERPLLLAGDFNVPRSSHWGRRLKQLGYPSVFQVAGRGWHGSWPGFLPLYDLVQVRGSETAFVFHRAQSGPGLHSDHRMLDVWLTRKTEGGHFR